VKVHLGPEADAGAHGAGLFGSRQRSSSGQRHPATGF